MKQLKTMGLLLLVGACGGDVGTQPSEVDAMPRDARDVPGLRTAIVAGGSSGAGTMDLHAEVVLGPEGSTDVAAVVEGGTYRVEERVCRPARSNPAHPSGEKCRWEVYTVPEDSFSDFAGEDLRNVANDGFLLILDIPVTMLRISYRAKGTSGAENVLDCPWFPFESIYFCNSDGSVSFLSVDDAREAHDVMRRMQAAVKRR